LELLSALAGSCFALSLSGRVVVFIHELKHKILVGLVGAKTTDLKIHDDETGSIEFEYDTSTKPFIPFIALAPYFLPLLTIITVPFWTIFLGAAENTKQAIFGFAAMFDICFNIRELHPNQSDLAIVAGGVSVAKLFIYSFNVALFDLVLLITIHGLEFVPKALKKSLSFLLFFTGIQ
jgi:hypothetical protein